MPEARVDEVLSITQETADHKFTVQSISTKPGALTIAVDTDTHRLYTDRRDDPRQSW